MKIFETIYKKLIDIKFWTVLSVIITLLSLIPIVRSFSNERVELVHNGEKKVTGTDIFSFISYIAGTQKLQIDTIRAQIPLSFENYENHAIDLSYSVTSSNYYTDKPNALYLWPFYYNPTNFTEQLLTKDRSCMAIKTSILSKQTEPVAVAINIPAKELTENHFFKSELYIKWSYEKMGKPKMCKVAIYFTDAYGVTHLDSIREKYNIEPNSAFVAMMPHPSLHNQHLWLPPTI